MNAFEPLTTHSVAVAGVEHRLGARGTGVGAGIRLGEPEARERAAGDEVGQEALLLGLGCRR